MADVDDEVNRSMDEEGAVREEKDEYIPAYRMLTEDRIPVSKKLGSLWKMRQEAAKSRIKTNKDDQRWDAAIRYYRNDHSSGRETNDSHTDGNTNLATRGVETENIVFANASALVPSIYAKNPSVEVSMDDKEFEDFGTVCSRLIDVLFRTKHKPGVNMKRKGRKAVILANLTNYAYFEVGYTFKENASETVIEQLEKCGKELQEAKSAKEIQEIEGKLMAMERRLDLLEPSGPWVKLRRPHDVLFDPDATEIEDAAWLMIGDYLSTAYLREVYGRKNEKGEYESVFHPSHVLRVEANDKDALDDEVKNFSLFASDNTKSYTDLGFDSEEAYQKAQRTRVWYVWDKATRRIYLFNEHDWSYPLWVWEDPYDFPGFFPIVPLSFYDDPIDMYAKSEVVMYLDQQDAINMINNEVAKVRSYIVGKAIYNKSIIKDEKLVEEFLEGTNKRVLGVDLPPDGDVTKLLSAFVPQSAQFLNTLVFDKSRLLEAIDRVSSVTNVMRGVEYKTNTTNKAIESYQSNTQSRLDEKIDAVEDALGEVGEMLLHLCMHHMEADDVKKLLGPDDARIWEEGSTRFLETGERFSMQVVGGSTMKPTSATKKTQALELGQVVGQFANSSPTALLVVLKMFERAFDEVIITKEEWEAISASIEQKVQAENQPTQSQAQPQSPQGQGTPGGEGGQPQGDMLSQVEQIIDTLPPQLREALGTMIAQGTPVRQAVQQVAQELQGAS